MNEENISLSIKYWGVRGSVPTPLTTKEIRFKEQELIKRIIKDGGTDKLFKNTEDDSIQEYLSNLEPSLSGTYGGDTTCVEIQAKDSPLIVIDAGSGIRGLGRDVLVRLFSGKNLNPLNTDEKSKKDIHLFFSHYHWDHLQGFPFFGPSFIPGGNKVNIHFYGKRDARQRLSEVLAGQQQYPNFPVVWGDMPCVDSDNQYHEVRRTEPSFIELGKAKVLFQELTHPDAVLAYSVEVNGKKFTFASDTEHKDGPDPRLVKLAKDADALYYDAQYTPEEYKGDPKSLTGGLPKFDWGHSTYEWAIKNALASNVKTIVLGHHEPLRDDFGLETLLERAINFKEDMLKLPEHNGKQLNVTLAYQGMEQRF